MAHLENASTRAIPELEDHHYDIGIFGMWFGENYGSVLTYYALRKALIDMGHSVLMLDKPVLRESGDDEFNPNIHSRIFAMDEGYDISPAIRVADFSAFNRYCDTFIVGSDQVWNYHIARYFRGLTYLSFADDSSKRISYASSFGHASSLTPKEALSDVAKQLNAFDAISVRESRGVDIARNEFGVYATQVVDPIYLHDASDYDSIMEQPPESMFPDSEYLLCYVLDPSPAIAQVITSAAKKKGLEPVIVLDGRGDLEKAKKTLGVASAFRCPNARQWLYYIKNASYMITDSFHGASFAMLFHTQVSILANKRGASRIESFTETYNVPFIYAHDENELKGIVESSKQINFQEFDDILSMERDRSEKWLREALSLPPKNKHTVACVAKKECCGCGACYSSCPVNAITMDPDSEGFLYPSLDSQVCIECGKCTKACPSLNPRLEKSAKPLCFAAYGDDSVREVSSSGGLFTLIARKILANEGRVCGAAFDETFTLRQAWAETEEELEPLRMSKYLQSYTGESYIESKNALENGKEVLYVGCPCQVAGLNSFLGKDYENLFTIDLLCHGGPSQMVFEKYLDEVHKGKGIQYVGFRDKDYFGWSTEMTIRYTDGGIYRQKRDRDLFYRAFLPCFSVRPHCQVCNYSRLPRQGDITLGDFWGVSKLDKRFADGKGTSIVTANSTRGLRMIETLWDELNLLETVPREHILTHGQPFGNPFRNDPKRTRFFRMIENTSLDTAVTNAKSGVFDFALLGTHGDTCGNILRSYAIAKTLERANHSVVVVRRPNSCNPVPYPEKYRFRDFMNERVSTFSSHESLEAQSDLKYYCRGFVSEDVLAPQPKVTGSKDIVTYRRAIDSKEPISPLFLLRKEDYLGLISRFDSEDAGSEIQLFFRNNNFAFDVVRNVLDSHGMKYDTINADESVERWIQALAHAKCVLTDDADAAFVSNILDVPSALVNQKSCNGASAVIGNWSFTDDLSINVDDVYDFISNNPKSPLSTAYSDAVEQWKACFIERAENGMGNPIERPSNKDEDTTKPKHGKVYRSVSKRVPKELKRRIKKLVKIPLCS